MTWMSDRSGMASSGVLKTAHAPAATIAAINNTISRRFRALNSMTRASILLPAHVHSRHVHSALIAFLLLAFHFHSAHFHAAHAGHPAHASAEAEPAFRIDQKVGRGHHAIAFLQPGEHLVLLLEAEWADRHF